MNESVQYNLLFILVIAWSVFWTGVALWRAAKDDQKNWFVANLVLGNITNGLFPIIYLFWFAKKRFTLKEMKDWNWKFWKRQPPRSHTESS